MLWKPCIRISVLIILVNLQAECLEQTMLQYHVCLSPVLYISGDRSIISICLVRSDLGFASLHCFAIKRILGIIQGFVFYLVDVKPSKCDPKLVLESVFDLCGL